MRTGSLNRATSGFETVSGVSKKADAAADLFRKVLREMDLVLIVSYG
jgi:hypothetical protein